MEQKNGRSQNIRAHDFSMRTEYNDLEEIGGLTIASSILNQAKILQELKQHQEEMSGRMEKNFKPTYLKR